MKEESDASNDVLERLASCHLITPHKHLLLSKQDSPPHASSSPSSTSVSSITSTSKVSSSTNGNGASLGGVASIGSPLEDMFRAHYESLAAAAMVSRLGVHPGIGSDQSRILLSMTEMARSMALSSTNSTSSDGSNGGSPISSIGLPVKTKSKPGAKARSPGSGPVASSTGNREKVFVCQTCDRSFGYKHVLQNHERTHTGEKPFECRECHKRFTRDHHLKTHMRLHTGEKPYHCSHCDRQFVQVANLRRHLRVHTGEKPYACELCTSRFSDSNQLKAHMLIHKGEKPFQCRKCDGRFRRRHHLMHHKCPKDEANLGKPRRGRRPKAYEQLQSASPNSLSSRPGSADDLMAHFPLLSTTAAAVSSTTSNASTNNFYLHNNSKPSSHHLPQRIPHHLLSPSANMPPTTRHFEDIVPKSRRKPRHTNRILPQSQHDLFDDVADHDDDHSDVQTQPLNLVLNRRVFNSSPDTDDDVLDLSRSRSDAESEPEPIEEDEEDEDVTVKEEQEEEDELVMVHPNSGYRNENGQESFKSHPLSFNKHYSNNHINKNNHCTNNSIFSPKFQSLDQKALLDNGNGITALDLAFSFTQLENLKMKTSNTNGVPVPLIKSSNQSNNVAAKSIVNK